MLTVNHISKTYHHKKILNDVSFQVKQGEIVVLLGKSGVGKSTILRVLSHLETIDSGSLTLHNQPLDFLKVGMVFQDFNLFSHLTVLENITLPLIHVAHQSKEEAITQAIKLLKQFDMHEYASVYPISLSGGQKQRVAFARALSLKPEVLCLDEPTSALDPQLTNQVAQIIKSLAQEKIMIIIATHDIGLLQNLNCTIHLMQNGSIIQTASSHDLENSSENFTIIKKFIDGKDDL